MAISQLAAAFAVTFFSITLIVAAVQDARTFRIGNRLVAALCFAWIALAPLAGSTLTALGTDALVAFAVLAGGFALFAFGWIGGGDAKLACAAALFVGAGNVPAFLIYAALIGGGLGMLLLAVRYAPLPAAAISNGWVVRARDPGTGIPYALALAPAALLVLPSTHWFAQLGF